MMNIQQKRDLLMSLPLMEQEQRWIMERLDTCLLSTSDAADE